MEVILGHRVAYEIQDHEGKVVARMFSDNSHPNVNPAREFITRAKDAISPSTLIRELMLLRYYTTGGGNAGGDWMFSFSTVEGPDEFYTVRWPVGPTQRGAEVTGYTRMG